MNDDLNITKVESFKETDPALQKKQKAAKARKKRRALIVYIAIQSIMIAIMLCALAKLGENLEDNVEGNEHREMMEKFVVDSEEVVYASPKRTEPAYPMPTPERVTYPEDNRPTLSTLKYLKNVNEDFRFWIYIPGTEVSYYVMQGEDNDEYLHTNIYGNTTQSGSCFLDFRCNGKTMAGHTIVYGHTMNSLTVFGELRKYLEEDFYKKWNYVYTYSTEGVTVWRIFSVYITTTDEYYIQTYFENKDAYYKFITNLQDKSMYESNEALSVDDDVMTLSTCYRPYQGAKGRLTVHCVKIGTAPIM